MYTEPSDADLLKAKELVGQFPRSRNKATEEFLASIEPLSVRMMVVAYLLYQRSKEGFLSDCILHALGDEFNGLSADFERELSNGLRVTGLVRVFTVGEISVSLIVPTQQMAQALDMKDVDIRTADLMERFQESASHDSIDSKMRAAYNQAARALKQHGRCTALLIANIMQQYLNLADG